MRDENDGEDGSKLLRIVEAIAIRPQQAKRLVSSYRSWAKNKHPGEDDRKVRDRVAERIVRRYARVGSASGGTTALAGVVPGLGTVAAALGGGATDAAVCMKLEFDMCLCLAELYGYDVVTDDAKHLAFLIAAGTTVEHAAAGGVIKVASHAGVRLLRQYLKGAALQAVKQLLKKVGIIFTRKALEKALPFGIGVVVGGGANYALITYVGRQAIAWFETAESVPNDEGPDDDGGDAVPA